MYSSSSETAIKKYIPELDGIRCIAIALVLFGHWIIYGQLKQANLIIGSAGVNLFFVLSGFLITRIIIVQRVVYKSKGIAVFTNFYIRRSLRIFPLYYLTIVLGLLLAIPDARLYAGRLLTFTLNFPDTGYQLPNAGRFSHFWSLSAEEQFYIFFPLLLIVIPSRFYLKLFISLLLIGVGSRIVFYSLPVRSDYQEWLTYVLTVCCLDCFAMGAILAHLYCFNRAKLEKIISIFWPKIFIVALFITTVVLKMMDREDAVGNIFFRLSFSAICFYLLAFVLTKRLPEMMMCFLRNKMVVYIGKISFGIYVIHNFIPWTLAKMGLIKPFNFAILFYAMVYLLITILLAAISWKYFEKPLNNLKHKFPYKGG